MIISDVDTGCVLMVISGILVSWTVELSSIAGEIYSFHINRFSGTNRTIRYGLFRLKRFSGTKHRSSLMMSVEQNILTNSSVCKTY